jgi:hypothetical protein
MTTPDSASDSTTRPSLTDSPWFWAYVFGAAALVALFAANFKFGPRQAQIEREFQARTRAAQKMNGQEPSIKLSTPQNTLITLGPLWIVLAVITLVGWFLFWQSRRAAIHNSALTSAHQHSSPLSSSAASTSHVDPGQ